MDIGSRIKNEREKQQVSREEVAKAIGKSVEFVAKVEGGQRRLSIEDLVSVANLLGRPIEFFTGDEEESQIEKDLASLMESAELDPKYKLQLQGVPRLQTKEAIVELAKQQKAHQSGIFRQEILESETEVLKNGDSLSWWRSRIHVLDRELPTLAVGYICLLDLKVECCRQYVKLLEERCGCKHAKMEVGKVQDIFNVPSVAILFHPPLRRGDIADVCAEEFYRKAFLLTRQEIQKSLKERKCSVDMPRECLGINVFAPTDSLRIRISFPKEYGIDNVESYAVISRMRLFDECDRLNREQCLSKMRVGSRWVLELKVHRPVVGTQYFISWRPTKKKDSFIKSVSQDTVSFLKETI